MLESFVEKFQYVQDEISSSFRGLTLGEPLKPKQHLNVDAGCALLSKYQDAWEEMHVFGETNARLADDIDQDIGKIYHSLFQQKRSWEIFQKEFTYLEKVKVEVETVVNTLGDLRSKCSEIEEALLKLENLIEIQDFYSNEAQEKIKLSTYRVDKLKSLDAYRELLAEEHNSKIKDLEQAELSMKQTNRDVFNAKFNEDLEFYRRTGEIPQAENAKPNQSQILEEVTLDEDPQVLEEYLES